MISLCLIKIKSNSEKKKKKLEVCPAWIWGMDVPMECKCVFTNILT